MGIRAQRKLSRWANALTLAISIPGALLAQTAGKPDPGKSNESATPAAASAPDASVSDSSRPAVPSDYRVGAQDELIVSVWHEPELSEDVAVRPDGMITLPLLNDVKVTGLTTSELQALLTEKLKSVVNDPQVTIIVKAVNSRKVFLVGNVLKQGAYPLMSRTTVLELIAQAGGLGPFAKSGSIYILRKSENKETRIPFNYKKALSGKGADPVLEPNDMVVVP